MVTWYCCESDMQLHKRRSFKVPVSVVSSDPPLKDSNARFPTVPEKSLSAQVQS